VINLEIINCNNVRLIN